ncbi:MAG: biopolymer transporter ExbD [Gallionella sp.]
MSFQNRSDQEMMSEINVTPLVDVMLVLLVVFIVTAPLLTQSVGVKLPKTVTTGVTSPSLHQIVSIDAQGEIRLNDIHMDESILATQLAAMTSKDPNLELQVDADTTVPYGKVAQLMAIAQRAGVAKLSFVSNAVH